MRGTHRLGLLGLGLGVVLAATTSADATTLRRMGLGELTRTNETVVAGRVVDAASYWNADGTFILTDVTFATDDVLAGSRSKGELTLTIMGGTVGETTTLIVAGAELVPGNEYLLFLAPNDLPGAPAVLSVRDHCQAVFDVVRDERGARAVSQATQHPLLSDDFGIAEPPGGAEGLELSYMTSQIRRFAAAVKK